MTDAGFGSPTADAPLVGAELDQRSRDILDFEREWWRHAGAKEQAIRARFDVSPTRYYQLLNAVIDQDAAITLDPMLVKRLRRMRATRQRQRAVRRTGSGSR